MSRPTQYPQQHTAGAMNKYPESEENVLRKYLPCIPKADISIIPEAIIKSTLQHLQEHQARVQQQWQQDCSGVQENSLKQEIPSQQLLQVSYNSPALTRLVIDKIIGQLDEPKERLDTQFHLLHMRTLAEEQEKTIQRAMIEGEKSKFQKKAAEFDKYPRQDPMVFSQSFYAKQLSLQEQYISPRYYSSMNQGTYKQLRVENPQLCLGVRSQNFGYSQGQMNNTARKENITENNSQQNFLLSSRSQNMYNQKCKQRNVENLHSYSTSKGIVNSKETSNNEQQQYKSESTLKQGILTAALSSQNSSSSSSSSQSSQKESQNTLSRKGNSTSNTCYDNLQAAGKENNQNHSLGVISKITKDNKNKRKAQSSLNNHGHSLHQLRREQSSQQAYAGNNHAYSSMVAYQQVLSAQQINPTISQQNNFYDIYDSQNQQLQTYNNTNNNTNILKTSITNQNCNDNSHSQKQLNQNFQDNSYYYQQQQQSQAGISNSMNILIQNIQHNDFPCFKQLDDTFEVQGELERCVNGNNRNIINNTNNILVENHTNNRRLLSSSSHNLSNSCGYDDFFQSLSDSGTMGSSIISQSHQIVATQDNIDVQLQQQQLHQQIQPQSPRDKTNNNIDGQSPIDEEDMINNYLS